jgi:hypothetical protein
MHLTANPGQELLLTIETRDPDRNGIRLKAWAYPEAGSGNAGINIGGKQAIVSIPDSAKKGDTFHVVIEGTDNGMPALTRYRRVVISIR